LSTLRPLLTFYFC